MFRLRRVAEHTRTRGRRSRGAPGRIPFWSSAMKTLHLLRHAKSDWSNTLSDDFARPLSRRGKRARKALARHVASWPVDLVVCSPAERARATAKPLLEVLGCEVRYDDTRSVSCRRRLALTSRYPRLRWGLPKNRREAVSSTAARPSACTLRT
jgi:hypothetical protein